MAGAGLGWRAGGLFGGGDGQGDAERGGGRGRGHPRGRVRRPRLPAGEVARQGPSHWRLRSNPLAKAKQQSSWSSFAAAPCESVWRSFGPASGGGLRETAPNGLLACPLARARVPLHVGVMMQYMHTSKVSDFPEHSFTVSTQANGIRYLDGEYSSSSMPCRTRSTREARVPAREACKRGCP